MLRLLRRREFGLLLFILLIVIVITIRAPAFFNAANFVYILNDTAILFMVGIAQMMVILTAGIDLSVASGMAFTGMAVAMVNRFYPQIPTLLIVLMALGIGFLLGSFNGLLVSVGRIPPIITTLGTLSIYRGFVIVLSGGQSVNAYQMTDGFQNLPRAPFLGLPSLIWFAAVTVAVFAVFLSYTKTGREIYAVGGSQLASQYVGIAVRKIQYLVFMFSGIIVGFSGLLWVARYASAQNDSATGFELATIAACVVGGVSIMGGSGSVWGVTLGALFLGIVTNALTQVRISPFWQQAIQGFVIVVAIVLNAVVDRRNRRLFARRILRE
jgi:rhamnose transport system permease protein